MRFVVTGLSGNLGTALLRRLLPALDAGEHEVLGVCRRPADDAEPYDRAEWACVDLGAPDAAEALGPLLRGADAVVHLAWLFQPSHDIGYLERVGVGGTAAVLDACIAAQVPHLVHMSSLGVYAAGPSSASGPRVDESWPHDGIRSLAYSRHKAWAERVLDGHPADAAPVVTRLRPALVLQRRAASGLLRYGTPAWLPSAALRLLPLLPVLPLDRGLVVQVVHADDVAAAVLAALDRRPAGAFNLAAEPPVTRDLVAEALGAAPVHVPLAVLRALVAAGWHTRLQPLDPGWLDLAALSPLMRSDCAANELGWTPRHDARATLTDVLSGVREVESEEGSPPLRGRSTPRSLADAVRRGTVGRRRLT